VERGEERQCRRVQGGAEDEVRESHDYAKLGDHVMTFGACRGQSRNIQSQTQLNLRSVEVL
jgi:hypothetical protein